MPCLAEGDRGLWRAGTRGSRARRPRSLDPAGYRRLALLSGPSQRSAYAITLGPMAARIALPRFGAQHPGDTVRPEAEPVPAIATPRCRGVRHQKRRPGPDRQQQVAGAYARAVGHRGVGTHVGEAFALGQPSSALSQPGQTNPPANRARKGNARTCFP